MANVTVYTWLQYCCNTLFLNYKQPQSFQKDTIIANASINNSICYTLTMLCPLKVLLPARWVNSLPDNNNDWQYKEVIQDHREIIRISHSRYHAQIRHWGNTIILVARCKVARDDVSMTGDQVAPFRVTTTFPQSTDWLEFCESIKTVVSWWCTSCNKY